MAMVDRPSEANMQYREIFGTMETAGGRGAGRYLGQEGWVEGRDLV